MNIQVKWKEGSCEKVYDHPVTAEQVMEEIQDQLPYQIMTCLKDNRPSRLDIVLDQDCALTLLDIRDKTAELAFQASLTLLYIKAVHDVLGETVHVVIHNALSKGLYTTVRRQGLTRNLLIKIENRMRELAEMDIPLERKVLKREEILSVLQERGDEDGRRMLENVPDLDEAEVYSLGREIGMYYTALVPSTGYLRLFALKKYKNGILLRFPSPADPGVIPPYKEEKLLYNAFAEETYWDHLMNVNFSADLNEHILSGNYRDLILLSEAFHEKKIAEIAASIRKSGKRIILVAGPSSSGKTTFSRRLCIQLQVAGLKPLYLGTDDYFLEREETPVGPDGEKNFEDLVAVDCNLFEQQMNDLLAGKEVDLPVFDFVEGKKIFGTRITSIDSSHVVVIEGIHALNPLLTANIPEEEKFRIYISPLTQLNLDDHTRISTTDARMLRRIVRDHQFRDRSAAETIRSWPSVRAGEEKNIFPFNGEADIFFNSHCMYELALLKTFARPLLEEIPSESPSYPDAVRMLNFLRFFAPLEDNVIIPSNSIMREFIGGSVFSL